MEFNDEKFIFKKDKFNLIIIQSVLLVLSFILGSILVLMILKYLKNISILNTFFIIIYIYFSQLIIEFTKYFMINIKFNNSNNYIVSFFRNLKFKFFIINFLMFILFGFIVFGCLLGGMFFSNFKILFTFIMGISLGCVYLFYTIELYKVVGYKIFKNDRKNIFVLVLINALIIILLINIFYLFKYLGILIFVFITLVNLVLLYINHRYLVNDRDKFDL